MRTFSEWRLDIVVLAVVASFASACGEDGAIEPDPEEPDPFDFSGDLIAFESDRDGNREIDLMTPDGSELVNITVDPAADADPAWSPMAPGSPSPRLGTAMPSSTSWTRTARTSRG